MISGQIGRKTKNVDSEMIIEDVFTLDGQGILLVFGADLEMRQRIAKGCKAQVTLTNGEVRVGNIVKFGAAGRFDFLSRTEWAERKPIGVILNCIETADQIPHRSMIRILTPDS